MQAERVFLETDVSGQLINLPKLAPNKQFEAIFLEMDDVANQPVKRLPHPDIAGKMKIKGDIFETVTADDWGVAE